LFVALGEFEVKPGCEERFEKVHGADGAWAGLFARHKAYRGTRLVKDAERESVYLTLDFWETREAYDEFKKESAAEYERMDRECERMIRSERKIGEFEAA
jgi:heme-degrading monooxygenase HmoA